jgi:predicted O-methyltransferase YrrM
MNLVEQHKYQENERILNQFVNDTRPSTIVELGFGTGALTVAMAYVLSEYNGKLYGYDLLSTDLAVSRLQERNLLQYCNLYQGDVYDLFLADPFEFDLILIDIHNTWEYIYNVVINNTFVNSTIKNGANVIIEGGAEAHPRINKHTLDSFHKSIGRTVFEFEHISGPRTSLSTLKLLI